MSSGRSARDTSIRQQASLYEWCGGVGIAEEATNGIQVGRVLPRLQLDHQGMEEVNGVDDAAKVDEEEEITALAEKEAGQIQCLPMPETPTLSDVLVQRCTHYLYRPWCPDCVEGRGREFWHRSMFKYI